MAERDLHAVDAIEGGIAGWGAAQGSHFGAGDKTHVHQVVLDIFGQVEGHQDSFVADRQFTQYAHLKNPVSPPEREGQRKIRPYWSQFSIRPNWLRLQSAFWGISVGGSPMTGRSDEGGLGRQPEIRLAREQSAGIPRPSLAPWRTLCSIHWKVILF